ncbi:MAG: NAD(+)/NADH kinase [Actinomycetota bacterium]
MSARAEPAAAVRTAVVLTHTHPEQTSAALREAVAAAERASCALAVTADELSKHGEAVGGIEVREDLPERPDLCLVLGGDGTILSALRRYANSGVPVFGINFGTVGFLAAVERDQLADGLSRAFGGDFDVLDLPGLRAQIDVPRPIALNDVSFIRRPQGRVAELSYRLGGQEVGHVRCDGLVAATPAGSTGYNLANQGPILAWGVEGYVVSFIAPHTLTARALVVAPDDVLQVGNAAGREAVDVVLDGEYVGELRSGEEIEVGFRRGVGRLAQLPGSNFYRRIGDKFGRIAH